IERSTHTSWQSKLLWLAVIGPILLTWLAVFHDVLRRLVGDWRVGGKYLHGFFIPVGSGHSIWSRREQILSTPVRPQWLLGGALMIVAVLMLFAGILGAELYITRLSLVLSLAGLAVYFGGSAWLRQLLFPIGLLLFALPVPNI